MPVAAKALSKRSISLVVQSGSMTSDPDTVVITVIDNSPPSISVWANPDSLWPPNHKMVTVNMTVEVSDNCDADPDIILISASSNEPDEDPLGGDGNTTDDIQGAEIGTDDDEIALRAERDGEGSGRVYTVTYMAVDSYGNSDRADATVTVPLDKGK